MFFSKRVCIALLFSFVTMAASAYTVSVMVIETGIRSKAPAPATSFRSSQIWENEFMEILQRPDRGQVGGHIVTNAPITWVYPRPNENLPDEAKTVLTNAAQNGVNYLILIILDYEGTADVRLPVPQRTVVRIFKVEPYQYIVELEYRGSRTTSVDEEINHARSAARDIRKEINDLQERERLGRTP